MLCLFLPVILRIMFLGFENGKNKEIIIKYGLSKKVYLCKRMDFFCFIWYIYFKDTDLYNKALLQNDIYHVKG
jgi:hypothetical protein